MKDWYYFKYFLSELIKLQSIILIKIFKIFVFCVYFSFFASFPYHKMKNTNLTFSEQSKNSWEKEKTQFSHYFRTVIAVLFMTEILRLNKLTITIWKLLLHSCDNQDLDIVIKECAMFLSKQFYRHVLSLTEETLHCQNIGVILHQVATKSGVRQHYQ